MRRRAFIAGLASAAAWPVAGARAATRAATAPGIGAFLQELAMSR
jgi:hypothetical protein